MFIVSLNYTKELNKVDSLISEHVTYLEKYYAQNKFIVSGRKNPRTGGVILMNCSNIDEVNNIIEEDPFFKARVAEYDVTEIIPTMTAPSFELFKEFV